MPFSFVGQSVESESAQHARVEVMLDRPSAKSDAAPIVFVTKYASGQVGNRSVGMSPRSAREVAALLIRAADACAPE